MTTHWMPLNRGALAQMRAELAARKLANEPISITTTTVSEPAPVPVVVAEPVVITTWTPAHHPNVGAMMPIDMVTYAVVGLIDNDDKPLEYTCKKTGKVRKRQKNLRYKLSIEAWVLPAHLIQKRAGGQFSRNVQLRKATSFETKIIDVNLDKGTFSEAFARELRDLVALNDPDDLYGIISDHENGFTYYPRQFVHVTFKADEEGNLMPVATIYVDGVKLVANAMTSLFLTTPQKTMGLVAQQYIDRCGYAIHTKAQKAARAASGGSKA